MVVTEARQLENWIGGAWVAPAATEFQDVLDPATGEVLARVPISGAEEVDRAARVAHEAWRTWSDTPVMERARVMFRLQNLYEQHLDELGELVVRENGKSIQEGRGEVRRGIDVIEFAAGMPTLMQGGTVENVSRGVVNVVIRAGLAVNAY